MAAEFDPRRFNVCQLIQEVYMLDTNMRFARGMFIGMIAGAAVGATLMPKKKSSKNYAGRALRTAGGVLDQISDILGA